MNERQRDLLMWAVDNMDEQGDEEDRHEVKMMDPSEIGPEWYDALFGKTEVEKMVEILDILGADDAPADVVVAGLEEISFMVETTHNANDLCKINGLSRVAELLEHESEDVRLHAAWIIAKGSANNPEFQNSVMALPLALPMLINILHTDDSLKVRAKALHAISCVVRGCRAGLEMFVLNDGVEGLFDVLRNGDRNMRRRVVFFLQYLLDHDMNGQLRVGEIVGENMESVFEWLVEPDIDYREKALLMLLKLLDVDIEFGRSILEINGADILVRVRAEEESQVDDFYNPFEILGMIDELLQRLQ